MVIGINPSVGLTTLLVLMLAWAFGLNQVASHIGSYAVAPLHLLLFLPFIQMGVYLFHLRRLPLSRQQIEHLSIIPCACFMRSGNGNGMRWWCGALWLLSQCLCWLYIFDAFWC
jgi:hypothetical protein